MMVAAVKRSSPLLVAWLSGVSTVTWAARFLKPSPIAGVGQSGYPLDEVLLILSLMTAQAAILLAVLRPWSYRRSWVRALTAFIVSLFFWRVVAVFFFFHGVAETYLSVYGWWMMAMSFGTFGLFLWSALVSLPATPAEGSNDVTDA